jgi:molybdate transport system regulatory protein
MKIAYKVWLDNKGKAFGEGPYELLQEIEKIGSLHQSAKKLGMSYRKAWMILQRSEKKLGFLLLERTVGGVAGGGSRITPSGRRLMKNYAKFRKEVKESLERIYQKHFG